MSLLTTEPLFEGMPALGSLRLLTGEGEAVVLSGRWVLFRFAVEDTGMRRMAMVALTEAGHGVKTVAQVFGVHPNYLSTLRKTAREQGSTGLVKAMGRPVKLSLAQLRQAQRWVGQGVSGQEIARRLQVSDTMISRLVGGRRRPELVQDELPDPELPDPRCRHRSRAGSGRAGPGRRAARAGRARARWRAGRGGAGGRARGVRAAG